MKHTKNKVQEKKDHFINCSQSQNIKDAALTNEITNKAFSILEEIGHHNAQLNNLTHSVNRLEDESQHIEDRLNNRIDILNTTLNGRIDNLNTTLSEQINNLSSRVSTSIQDLRNNDERLLRWSVGMLITMIIGFLGLFLKSSI